MIQQHAAYGRQPSLTQDRTLICLHPHINLSLFIPHITFEGMIVITPPKKKLDLEELATTLLGEHAYYGDPSFMTYDGESRSGKSFSGEEWYPNILDFGRLTAFIPGNPGAGKSYLANELIELLPRNYEVLLFTALDEEDGNFQDLKGRLYKIKMTPENLKKLTLPVIRQIAKNPILLFDDIDKIRDKEVERLTFALLEDALANGRGHRKHDGRGDIHVIVTSHSLNDYRKTKYTLENSDYVAVFPQSTTYAQMRRLFDKIGLNKEMCDEVMELGKRGLVRRVIIKKVAPMYIITGDTITLI